MRHREIARRRMLVQRLWGRPFENPEEVVRWLAAVQAQEFPVAKWSVAQRAAGVTAAAMERAFADGAILRTHVLRPTWHFVLPADIRWLLALSAPRVNALNAHYYRKLELDDRLFGKSNRLIARALDAGGQLTRKDLAAVLDRAGIVASGPRLGFVMMRAELDGVVCSGAPRGRQHTYALLDERAPKAGALDPDEGLAELTRRYFTARGPATLKDYLRWSSLTVAEGTRGLEIVRSQLECEITDGRTYWFAASGPWPTIASPVVDLVQGYDECIMSYSESRDVLRLPLPTGAAPQDTIPFLHAVLLDGQLIGHWRHAPKSRPVVIETDIHRPLNSSEARALDDAVARYGRFLGVPVALA